MIGEGAERTKAVLARERYVLEVTQQHGLSPGPSEPWIILTEAEALVAAVERVQELHFRYVPFAVDFDCCAECNQNSGGYVAWPCPTIQAVEIP